MGAGAARGSGCLPGSDEVLVTCLRAQQKYPMEYRDKTIAHCAQHENVQSSHAAFQQREFHFRRYIGERKNSPCGQAGDEHPGGFIVKAQDGNRHQQNHSCTGGEIPGSGKRIKLWKAISDQQPDDKSARKIDSREHTNAQRCVAQPQEPPHARELGSGRHFLLSLLR